MMARNVGRTEQSKVGRDNVAAYGLGSPIGNMGGYKRAVGQGPASRVAGPAVYPTADPTGPATGHGGGTSALVPAAGVNQPQGITGTITPSPVARAFKQGFEQGAAKVTTTAPKARPKATVVVKPKAKVAAVAKSAPPKAGPKAEAQPKGLMGKIGKALANNKANIQKKAADRVKASGRKG